MPPKEENFDAIVVGAGPAGLYAAYILQERHGKNALVLEAKDRIGGRLCAVKVRCATGTETWDLGGQWTGKTQHNLLGVLSEFGLQTSKQFGHGKSRMILHNLSNVHSISGSDTPFKSQELLELHKLKQKIEALVQTIDVDNVSSHPSALEWDSTTMHSFIVENCKYEAVREMMEASVRVLFGVDMSQLTFLFFLYYCKQAGSYQALLGTEHAQEYAVKGSMHQICTRMAEKLENVTLSEPVVAVEQVDDAVTVTTKSGKTFQSSHLIIAIPPHLVNAIQFSPPLPNDRVRVGEMMVGHAIKCIVTYKTAFWREKGLSGDGTSLNLPCATGQIVTLDGTLEDVNPAIICFICAEQGMYWTQKTMAERREAILKSLAALFGDEALLPIDYVDKDWSKEPYNGGCPVDIFRPRGLLYYHHALKQPFGRIHWAGTETARVWMGHIDGALESAIRAVSEITGDEQSTMQWKESPVFENYRNYVSKISEKKSWSVKTGGGIAGLYAAYLLQKDHGQRVLVLEAKDRIGGRLLGAKIKCAKGTDTWDLGGQWVGKTQHRLLKALSKFDLETYEQFSTGRKKLMLRGFDDIRSYAGLIPTIGPLELLEINSLIKRVTKMSDSIDLENVTSHPNAVEWDSITIHSFMADNCKYDTIKEIMETALRVVLGVDLSQTSLLFFLYYCKQGGNFETLLDAKNGGAQELRVKGSMYQLPQKIAETLHSLLTDEPVQSVEQTKKGIVEVKTKTGKSFRCEDVIMAIPPHLVNNIEFSPPLPYDRLKLGETMLPSHYIKFVATYRTTFWKEKGFSGEITATTLPCATGPITVTFDGTTSNENPAIIGFICAEHALYWTSKTMDERKEAVLQSLAANLGVEALSPIEYIDKDWSKEPYNGGCPVSVMRPRGLTYYHHALKQPFGRIHWAGTETAGGWCGYIDGALESAIRATEEIAESEPSPTLWKESPAFSNYLKYTAGFKDEKSSIIWTTIGVSAGVALAGLLLGYYMLKE